VAWGHSVSSRSSSICSLIYGADSLCQLPQHYGQRHKHFTDKDGQLFTDEAKVLLAAAVVCVCVCVCRRKCVRGRQRGWGKERGWQRERLMYGHFWFAHLQVSTGTHLSNALNADSNLGLSYMSEQYKVRRAPSLFIHSHLHSPFISFFFLMRSSHSPLAILHLNPISSIVWPWTKHILSLNPPKCILASTSPARFPLWEKQRGVLQAEC